MLRKNLNRSEYAGFYEKYIHKIPENTSVTEVFSLCFDEVCTFFEGLSEEKAHYAYAEGKWTLKEVLLHLVDCERIFAYRALCFARQDKTELPGFEQNDYVPVSNANSRTMESLLNEYKSIRLATITLFESFDEKALLQIGKANGYEVSVRALAFIIAGHEQHHLDIAKERYF